jgi:hypothetical protein
MKRSLGTLLAGATLVAVAACGSQSSSTATSGPAGQPSSPSSDPNLTIDATTIALLSQTGGRGQQSSSATPLSTPAQISAFTAGMAEPLVHRITRTLASASPPDGTQLAGAVVSIGCDVPPGVDVVRGVDQPQIIAREVASPHPECLAPVTTVAIVAIPNA